MLLKVGYSLQLRLARHTARSSESRSSCEDQSFVRHFCSLCGGGEGDRSIESECFRGEGKSFGSKEEVGRCDRGCERDEGFVLVSWSDGEAVAKMKVVSDISEVAAKLEKARRG